MENQAQEPGQAPTTKKVRPPLTPNQKVIYDWFVGVMERTGTHPTCPEVMAQFSLSIDSACRYLKEICGKGYLVKNKKHKFSFKFPEEKS